MSEYWGLTLMRIEDSIGGLQMYGRRHPESVVLEKYVEKQVKLYEEFVYVTRRFSVLGTSTSVVREYLKRVRANPKSKYFGREEFLKILRDEEMAFPLTESVREAMRSEKNKGYVLFKVQGNGQLSFY